MEICLAVTKIKANNSIEPGKHHRIRNLHAPSGNVHGNNSIPEQILALADDRHKVQHPLKFTAQLLVELVRAVALRTNCPGKFAGSGSVTL